MAGLQDKKSEKAEKERLKQAKRFLKKSEFLESVATL
jgi:hypothetical protein